MQKQLNMYQQVREGLNRGRWGAKKVAEIHAGTKLALRELCVSNRTQYNEMYTMLKAKGHSGREDTKSYLHLTSAWTYLHNMNQSKYESSKQKGFNAMNEILMFAMDKGGQGCSVIKMAGEIDVVGCVRDNEEAVLRLGDAMKIQHLKYEVAGVMCDVCNYWQ